MPLAIAGFLHHEVQTWWCGVPRVNACDVCIIGLGPVGATLASLLGSLNLSVVVLEREGAAYPLPRAVAFDDEVMRVFETIGVAHAVGAVSRRSPGMHFKDPAGNLIVDWTRPDAVTPQGWYTSYRFHQPDLERILRESLARYSNVETRARCEAFAIEESRDSARVSYENLESGVLSTIEASYVVGCDGSRSLVRRSIGSDLLHLGYRRQWVVIDVLLERELDELGDFSIQFCHPERPATYVRGVRNRRRWEISALPGEEPANLVRPATIWRLLQPWITPEDATIDRASVYTFESAVAARWRRGRAMIAGDAAHQTPPFLGQGMCAGIRDAANLAWKLDATISGRAPEALLDTFQSERDPHVRRYIEKAIECGAIISAPPASSEPTRMSTIAPPLGPGLHGANAAPAGMLAPQPEVRRGGRADAYAGYGFALYCDPDFASGLPADLRSEIERCNVCIVDDIEGSAGTASITPALLVRPDRYVLAALLSYGELARALDRLPSSRTAPNAPV